MVLTIHPENPEPRKITQLAEILRKGGVAVIPTDSVYAFVCSLEQQRGFEHVCRLKGIRPEKAKFSILCSDLSNISVYTKPFDRAVYKMLNKALPGPYTFILEAGSEVPSLFRSKRKTVGLRVPDHPIVQALIESLGCPLVASSLHDDDEITPYPTDPDEIADKWENRVDVVVDGGPGHNVPTTIIDCTGDEPELVRVGAGDPSVI
jgi:tRNA threonylcarbamoyl adenosine modification protein (Sua5/YciO/YrdC/YwlC family)